MGSPSFRLGLLFAAVFLAPGLRLPFWPLWLRARGIDPEMVAVVLAVGTWVRVLVTPFVVALADRMPRRVRFQLGIALAMATASLLYLPVEGVLAILAIEVLWNALSAPLVPLTDAIAVLWARRGTVDYGRTRLYGSLAFLGMNVFAAVICGGEAGWLLAVMIASCWAVAAALVGAPEPPVEPDGPGPAGSARGTASWREALSQPGFLALLAVCALIQGSHGALYGYGTLHWRAAGLSDPWIGCAWATGVVAEVFLFRSATRVLRRFPRRALLGIAGLAGVVRWVGTAYAAHPALVFGLQTLHALTYALTHVAAIAWLQERMPARIASTAQGLYATLAFGVSTGLTLLLSGGLHALAPELPFLGMAVLCGLAMAATLLFRRVAGPA